MGLGGNVGCGCAGGVGGVVGWGVRCVCGVSDFTIDGDSLVVLVVWEVVVHVKHRKVSWFEQDSKRKINWEKSAVLYYILVSKEERSILISNRRVR